MSTIILHIISCSNPIEIEELLYTPPNVFEEEYTDELYTAYEYLKEIMDYNYEEE